MFYRLFIVLVLITLTGCVSAPISKKTAPRAPEAAYKELKQAKILKKRRQLRSAVENFDSILKKYPETDIQDDAHIELARTFYSAKRYERAYGQANAIISSEFFSPYDIEARQLAAQSLYGMDKSDRAFELINSSLENPKLSLTQKSKFYEVKLKLLYKSGAQLETLETLMELSKTHPIAAKRRSYRRKARLFMESRLSAPQLKDVVSEEKYGAFKADALYFYALNLIQNGRAMESKGYLRDVIEAAPKSLVAEQARTTLEQIETQGQVVPNSLGVILPLSGKYKAIGQQVLRGLKMALGISGSKNKHMIRLAVIDSLANPDIARKGVEKLVRENRVMAIVGGLSSRTGSAVAEKCQELGIPLLVLSKKSELTQVGGFVFRNALTAKEQIDQLLDLAMNKMKLNKFALLYPNDPFGVLHANVFWQSAIERGAKITGAQVYRPNETDFSSHIKKMVGTYYIEDRKDEYKSRLTEWKKKNRSRRKSVPVSVLPPIVDFDAIFIPDGPKAIGQIAPMLAYNDVRKVYLLGTNLWNNREFLKRGQNFVSRSLFIDSLVDNDPEYKNSKFYKNYTNSYSSKPGPFALQGFDSGVILQKVLSSSPQNRIEFLNKLKAARNLPGAIHKISLNDRREFSRPVKILTVSGGTIQPFSR